jgi:hypothetical protein
VEKKNAVNWHTAKKEFLVDANRRGKNLPFRTIYLLIDLSKKQEGG